MELQPCIRRVKWTAATAVVSHAILTAFGTRLVFCCCPSMSLISTKLIFIYDNNNSTPTGLLDTAANRNLAALLLSVFFGGLLSYFQAAAEVRPFVLGFGGLRLGCVRNSCLMPDTYMLLLSLAALSVTMSLISPSPKTTTTSGRRRRGAQPQRRPRDAGDVGRRGARAEDGGQCHTR